MKLTVGPARLSLVYWSGQGKLRSGRSDRPFSGAEGTYREAGVLKGDKEAGMRGWEAGEAMWRSRFHCTYFFAIHEFTTGRAKLKHTAFDSSTHLRSDRRSVKLRALEQEQVRFFFLFLLTRFWENSSRSDRGKRRPPAREEASPSSLQRRLTSKQETPVPAMTNLRQQKVRRTGRCCWLLSLQRRAMFRSEMRLLGSLGVAGAAGGSIAGHTAQLECRS